MTTINVRTDEKLKKAAGKVLKEMGLDMSNAVKLFLHQVVITKTIPFPVKTVKGFTPEEEKKLLKERKELKKAVKAGEVKLYDSIEELHAAILK